MDNHRAEVATATGTGAEAKAPFVLRVDHHRVGPAELRLDMLTGGHVLHLAAAICTFNNLARLARDRGISIDEASVSVDGDFTQDGNAVGLTVHAEVVGGAAADELRRLALDAAAESTVLEVIRTPTEIAIAEPQVSPASH